jgi:tetratricopeptide (TPR) repeat protein
MDIDVFVSHHTSSSLHIVEAIVNRLESAGLRCWYAPRNTEGDYAGSIARAINSCRVFLLILNKPASESVHVLNEIDMVVKRLSKSEDVSVIPFHVADEEISDAAQYYLGRMHWIDAMTPPMYQRVDELVERLRQLLCPVGEPKPGRAPQSQYRLITKIPQAREHFLGREDLMQEITDAFSAGNRVLFLEGLGGIGKSELAKQYALQNRDRFDKILFVTYTNGLCPMVCDKNLIQIEGLEQEQEESDAAFFTRKMQVFRTLADDRTLLIVDNFDVDTDPDLAVFTEGVHKILLTTRNAHAGYPSIRVNAIREPDVLLDIFERNYGSPLEEGDKPYLLELFERIEYHTYTIELIAKQMEASFLSGEEMLTLFKKGTVSTDLTETVVGRRSENTAFGHICSVFSTSQLSEEEKQLLRELSVLGITGVPANRFKEWAGLSSFEIVNRLIKRSWIRKEPGQRLSLHPLVGEVVRAILMPNAQNCYDFLARMTDFLFGAWGRPVKENVAVTENILSIAQYFQPIDFQILDVWFTLPSFLWQVGKFEASVQFGHILYDSCLAHYGEASMETGFAAKVLGGCYFNSGREEESIPWYQQGLRSMLLSGAPESEDLAMSYEKVARCYTWEYQQDFSKAETYFEQSLQIRFRLKEAFERGETPQVLESREHYNYEKAIERIGEAYMELGRMYQAMEEWEKALEMAQKQEKILVSQGSASPSSLAYDYYDEGVCYYHMGQKARKAGQEAEGMEHFASAHGLLTKALEINSKMRGEIALDTIRNEEYLADTYAAMGQLGDASNYYMAVITAYGNLLGEDCPHIARVKGKMDFQQAADVSKAGVHEV